MAEPSALGKVPYKAASLLCRVAWHRAFEASLGRAERANSVKSLAGKAKSAGHKKLAKEATEAWTTYAPKWADGPRGHKEGAEVAKALLDLAVAAAEHAAAQRVGLTTPKSERAAQKDAMKAWTTYEASLNLLKEHEEVVNESLVDCASNLVWSCAWYAANSVAENEDEPEDEECEDDGDEECDSEDGEGDQADEDEEEDEDAKFGENYPGSSDDFVEDHMCISGAFRTLFRGSEDAFHGARVFLPAAASSTARDAAEAAAVVSVREIAAVEGLPSIMKGGLNAVRLVLPAAAPDGSAPSASAVLQTLCAAVSAAEAAELRAVVEVPLESGKTAEQYLRKLGEALSQFKCVEGVALPRVHGLGDVTKLTAALREGGLDAKRCFISFPLVPVDEEGEWTDEAKAFFEANLEDAKLSLLAGDGNLVIEGPACMGDEEELEMFGELCDSYNLVSSWSLVAPDGGSGSKAKKGKEPSPEWYKEMSQRALGTMQECEVGWFHEVWDLPTGCNMELMFESSAPNGLPLKSCLEQGFIDFTSTEQVLYPRGKHTHSFIYLHGYTCTGYDYMSMPEYFMQVKKAKKKPSKSKAKKDKDGDGGDEDLDLEPYPGLKVILPSAPVRTIAYSGEETPSWHDYITDHDGEAEDDCPIEHLEEQAARIQRLIAAEAELVGARNVIVGGASQGCGVILHAVLTYEGEVGAVLGTMGHLLSCTPLPSEWAAKDIPVRCCIGMADSMMPWDKWVGDTWKRLQDAGVDVKIVKEEGVDHGDDGREMVWVRDFLADSMKSKPAAKKAAAKKSGAKKK